MHAFASSHIQVPQDIRLLGHDDIDVAAELEPFEAHNSVAGPLAKLRLARPGSTMSASKAPALDLPRSRW